MNRQHNVLERQTRAPFERKEDAPPSKTDAAVQRMMNAFEEFKATNDARLKAIEAKGTVDVLTEEKLQKIEATIAATEGMGQKLTLAEQQAKQAAEGANELKAQLDAIETKFGRMRAPGVDPKVEMKSTVNTWARGVIAAYQDGLPNLPEDQRKALDDVNAQYKAMSISNDTTGGYLAPAEYVAEIIKGVTEMSPVRSLVRLRTTASKSIMIPKRTGQFAARRTGETDTRTETDGLRYGMVEVNAPEMYAIIDIHEQNLEDSAFDLEAEIRFEAQEQFEVREGVEFAAGAKSDELEGILVNASIGSINSGHATTVTADGVLKLYHEVKTAYARNGVYVLNRKTLGAIRRLKDSQNQYLWMPGLAQGQPNSINGAPYVELPDMPDEAAAAAPVAFGDFRRGYTMLDRIAMSMLRDPFTQADNGVIRFRFRRRVGGKVTLPEAIKKLVCAA